MTNKELAAKLKEIATNYNTIYMWGVFGAPVTESVIAGKTKQYPSWYTAARQKTFRNLIGKNYFGFDCVCLIKGVLWGWNGNASANYGGAKYASNGVPDIGADTMIAKCSELSTDFSKIEIGEAVWLEGHIGVYIGDGLAVECTPKWENKVQITACNCTKSGYNRRNWTKHGKLPYITYVKEAPVTQPTPSAKKSVDELAREVIAGKWGNGATRKQRLTDAGYDYSAVQKRVNELCSQPTPSAKKSVDELAREVIAGKWGNGATRKQRLTDAGYDYSAVQKRINELLK